MNRECLAKAFRSTLLGAGAVLATASLGWAQMGPPPGAFEACNGKAQGAACSFETPRGAMNGACGAPPGQSGLICMPQGAGQGRGQGGAQGPGQGMGGQGMGGPGMQGGMPNQQMGGPQTGQGGLGQQQMGQQSPMGRRGPGSNTMGQGGMGQGGMGQGGMGPGGGGQGQNGADIQARYAGATKVPSRVPDTNQGTCFNLTGVIPCPAPGEPFFGQDAHYEGALPHYTDNGDGTVTDTVTGLVWQQAHNAKRLSFYDAQRTCQGLTLGGRTDWRLPSIKELFSLADFRGSQTRRFFIDDVFELKEPGQEVLQGDRFAASHSTQMMGQTWSSTLYTGVHFGRPGVEAAFFFNFLDGHIKQAPTRGQSTQFYRCVSGSAWGDNAYQDNGDGTVTDTALGLTWQRADDGRPRDWPGALAYCEGLALAGHDDWRLPNVKELQSIVDYTRNDPAIDVRYLKMSDKDGWYWSSTTHGDNINFASYVCFGKCVSAQGVDTHGAGAQRSDPKAGDPARFTSLGGQADEVRINNLVRCVR